MAASEPLPPAVGAALRRGLVIPALPLALTSRRRLDERRQKALCRYYLAAGAGGLAVGVVFGGFAWDHFGRYTFALLAFGYLLVAVCMWLVPAVYQVVERGRMRTMVERYWRLLRQPRLFLFIPAWISISALVGIWLSSQLTFILSSPRHVAGQFLMGSLSARGAGGHLSLVLGVYVLFFGLCLLFWAFFMNRTPRLLLMLSSITGVYLACIALAGLNHTSPGDTFWTVIWVALLFVGVFAESSFAPAALAYLADISEDAARDRGLLMGLYSVFLGLGQLLGNGLGGVFAQVWGFDGLVYLTAILAFVALVCLLVLFKVGNGTMPAATE